MRRSNTALVAVIDSGISGVSGDKYLGALAALGGSIQALRKVARIVGETLPGSGRVRVEVKDVERGEIGGKLVTVDTEKTPGRKGSAIRAAMEKSVVKLGFADWARKFSMGTVETLLNAEARVHGHTPSETVLHELGSADTLVDILGTASIIEGLGLSTARWVSTPVAVGGGVTRFSGRTYPSPPPAVVEILRQNKFPILGGDEKTELTTPTGAAITVNLTHAASETYPPMIPALIGYGAGSKELEGTANLLRLTIGETLQPGHPHDRVVVLETNVDDVTGEVLGYTMERLLEAGARDVTLTPVYMKKNRPGHVISVITDEAKAEHLAQVIMRETGSLGVRELPVRRHIMLRTQSIKEVQLGYQSERVRIKTGSDNQGRITEKPEYEDLKRTARKTGVSLREAGQLVKTAEVKKPRKA